MPARSPISTTTLTVLAAFWSSAAGTPARASVTPPGLYFHSFTGSATGSEWSTWGALEGEGRYEFSDLSAAGHYPATVTPEGGITLDHGRGTGMFRKDGSGTIDFTLGPNATFHSEFHRAPRTDERFPVFYTGAVFGQGGLTGAWSARVSTLDPDTGAVLTEGDETVHLLVQSTTVRLTTPGEAYYQGVWLADDQAGFRVVSPRPSDPRYRTFPGSATSETLDMVGDLRVTDADHVTVLLFFQSRAGLGHQVQTVRVYELSRVPAPGSAALLGAGVLTLARRRR